MSRRWRPRSAAVTVRLVEPLIEPEVALIVVVPAATAVATPAALMTTATRGDDGGDRGEARGPGGGAGRDLLATVTVGAGGGELLMLADGERRVGRRDR